MTKYNSEQCSKCGFSFDGGSIVETFIQQRDQGVKCWQGMSDEDIKRDVEGWPEEEILAYIEKIEEFDTRALSKLGYREGSEKEFLKNVLKRERDLYLGLYHNVYVSGSYSSPYRWGKQIGIEIQGQYDGISEWMCPNCKTRWNRFTREEIENE